MKFKHQTLSSILSQQVLQHKTPSIQYAFFDAHSIEYSYTSGYADIHNKIPVTNDTAYYAYSITKTFTALAVLQLAQNNIIDIDAPVIQYMTDFPYTNTITIKQLLTHTAGIPNPIPLAWIHTAHEHETFDSNSFFSAIFAKYANVQHKPNEKFSYSNLGYVLLGKLIEAVSGMKYEDYIRNNILYPLGLRSQDIDFTLAAMPHYAKGYHKRYSVSNLLLGFFIDKSIYMQAPEGSWNVFAQLYVNGASYGGLIGTPQAFIRYIQEFLKPNTVLLNDIYKSVLFAENFTYTHSPTGMCASWFTGTLKGNTYYTHAGGGGGYYAEVRIYPELGRGSVMFCNRTGIRDERFLDRLDSFFL